MPSGVSGHWFLYEDELLNNMGIRDPVADQVLFLSILKYDFTVDWSYERLMVGHKWVALSDRSILSAQKLVSRDPFIFYYYFLLKNEISF